MMSKKSRIRKARKAAEQLGQLDRLAQKPTDRTLPDLETGKMTMVDIVTPVYGSPKFLRSMLESLLRYEAGLLWTLTLVDDLGPDREETEEVYSEFTKDSRIRVFRNQKNSGFSVSNNNGFKRGRAPLLLLLNSDVLITHDNWLLRMAVEFKDPLVCAAGPKLLFFDETCPNYSPKPDRPPGKIQHAGVAFNLLGQPYHVFLGWDADHPKVSQRVEINCVTGACLMTRREVYMKIGGLDPDYTTGNFEDVQYCLQIRAAGGKIVYTPNVVLYHFAGGSGNSQTAIINQSIFQLKCKKLIEYDDWRRY